MARGRPYRGPVPPQTTTNPVPPARTRLLVLLFVSLQIALPTLLLAARWATNGSHPVDEYRFSWQMYSSAGGATTYAGVDADGRVRDLSVADLPPVVRGIAYDGTVPRLLCERHDGLVEVRRTVHEPGLEDGTFPC